MEKHVNIGDVVVSTAGRDQGKYFLVITVQNTIAYITNGRERKVTALKKKNIKHLRTLSKFTGIDLANAISNGKPVGNQRIYKLVKAEKQKLQED